MTESPQPQRSEPQPSGSPRSERQPSGPPRYEPGPGVGKLTLWVLVFVLAAVVVVAGGVYFG
ncbi:hypothetical protein [Streptomyces albicerus]|uniref:hypothetical protein n=1 Tax=Streptomyces albicerus TaxID=2569859 RepID=UPI00124B671A|nr:hypothetical protein [Streptomyces albicerus]